jgi:hypothetical protein
MATKKWQTLFSVIVLLGLAFSLAAPTGAQANAPRQDETGLKPTVSYAVQSDESRALRDVAQDFAAPESEGGEQPLLLLPKSQTGVTAEGSDEALQDALVTGQMPTLLANFEGIANIAGVAPPDTEGDMGYDPATGTKYYFQWVNLHLQVWNVTNPAAPVSVLGPTAGNAIWAGFGGVCQNTNDGDPIVLYDELAHRWFISQFSVAGPYYNCIAVSQTGDPTGAWYRYAFLYSATKMNDYPKYGVWPDGYYMTVNQFNNGSTWGGAGAAVYERAALLTGGAARQLVFDLYSANVNFGGMLPADFEGTPPALGTPNYFAEVDDTTFLGDPQDSMRIWQFHVDWANPANSTFGLNGQPNQILPVANFTPLCLSSRDCVPQPGTQKLDAIGDRLMYRLAYRVMDNGTQMMAVNHTVDAGSLRAGVRWYQLSAPNASSIWTLDQQGTYAGDNPASDTNHRWMGSIDIDRMGNLALGYSVSSGTVYPSVGLVGRLVTDPVNTLPQGELIAFSGTAAQSGVNRWGDYSSMSIDPTDGCTFWYTQEYSSGGWNWRTRISSFRYPSCTDQPTGHLAGTVTAAVGGAPIAGAQVVVGVYGATTGADGTYNIQLPAGNYSASFSAFGYLPKTVNNITVTVDQTTTVNAALDAAQLRVITGTVYDATPGGHSWPLYARIDIDGFPGSPIFTDAIDGTYSVSLPEGSEFAITATALAPGYQPGSVTYTVPAHADILDFGLLIDQVTCNAPGYSPIGLSQNFDTVTPPALPSGWAIVQTGGTNNSTAWATNVGTRYPSGYPAQSGANVAYFNSFSVTTGNASRLYETAPLNMPTVGGTDLTFWMFHDTGYSSSADTVQVQVSIDNGLSWINVGTPFNRYAASNAWTMHTVSLAAYASQTSLRVGFLATSAYGNDIHIDTINLGAGATCTAIPGAILSGYVFDDNTDLPLLGATVNTGAALAVAAATPQDPGLGDGFYSVFAPVGASVPVTAAKIPYVPLTLNLNIVSNTSVQQNFYLTAGILDTVPPAFTQTLPMNGSTTQTLNITNGGGANANFKLTEINTPVTNAPVSDDLAFNRRHVSPKRLNDITNPAAHFPLQSRQAPVILPNAGTVVNSFPTSLTSPWGVGFNTVAGDLWVGNIAAGGGDDLDYRFLTNGTNTGDTIDTSPWVGVFAADMTYNPLTGTLWQMDVGGDNCIHELDLSTRAATGNTICPAFGTSERGLAFDPITNTYFSGSWNDSIINRFDTNGVILEAVDVNLGIAGLAYNPATGHLFVTESGGTIAIHVLDVNANYTEIGSFNVAALHGGEAGLEIDCGGHLWAVNQTTKALLEITSDETGVCDWMAVPWLTENPVSGTVAPAGTQPVTLSFDATGLMPGIYEAQLAVSHNTPYAVSPVPVTLTVTLAAGYGDVAGTVNGLERCDVNPAPLKGALVEILSGTTVVYTTTTKADGSYVWAAAAGGPYTVRISLAGYVQQQSTFSLVAGQTATRNFELRRDLPCVTSSVPSLKANLAKDSTKTMYFNLLNIGAANGPFTLQEFPAPTTAGVTLPAETLVQEGFEGTFPPTNWTQIANNAITWASATYSPHTGAYYAHVEYDYNQDEWLLTPEMFLSEGTLSLWSFGSLYWCRDTYDNCDLNIWIVVGDVGGGDDILVGKGDDAWTTTWGWAQSTFNLTPLLPGGPVRIGFQYLGNDGAEIGLDDILLDGVENTDVPWLSESPLDGTVVGDGSQLITVGFDSTGLTEGTYKAILRVRLAPYGNIDIPVTMIVGGKIYLPTIGKQP